MKELPAIEEETPPSEGYSVPPLPQLLSQEGKSEAEVPTRTSLRICKAQERAIESRKQESLNLNKAFSAVQGEQDNHQYYEVIHQDNYKVQDSMQDPLVYLASSDPDTIYFDQVMKQPDRTDFMNAEIREVNSHCDIKHWKILTRKEVPKGQPILDLVWAMNRKRDIVTRKVYEWKARLNIYGGQKEYMVN